MKRRTIWQSIESGLRRSLQIPFRASMRGLTRGEHDIIRFSMYRRLREVFLEIRGSDDDSKGLSISGSQALSRMLCGKGDLVNVEYPEVSMLDLPFEDNTFDYVVSDQVLEHVGGNPFRAVAESRRVLRPGGVAVHTTCLLFPVHGYPDDFWRFTPNGLRLLCADFGEIVECGGWGNRYLFFLNWLGVFLEENVPTASWHPFHKAAVFNEERYPAVTWIVVRK